VAKIQGIYIPHDQHVFIAGRNGSGKTWLARKYLAGYENVFVLDTKGTLKWPEVPKEELTVITHIKDLPSVETPKCIYKPAVEEMELDYYDQFFKFIYFRKDTIVWIDEVMSVTPSPHTIPFYYKAILTRGRELGVAAWSLTQRPAGINLLPISEASHLMIFELNLPHDRKRLAEVSGADEINIRPGQFKFWYYNVKSNKAILAQLKES
jgi:hypothetical protein